MCTTNTIAGVLAGLALAAAAPAGAQAAKFVTVPPQTNPSGSGPLTFSFKPTSTASSAAVAFQLPDGVWHRCVGGSAGITVQVGPLPDGDYQVVIADDYTPSSVPIYSGAWYACQSTDPPGTAQSVYRFHVGDPPVVQPPADPGVGSTPTPVAQPAPSAPTPLVARNMPVALSVASARNAALHKARRTWHAHHPKVVSVHRLSANKVACRVRWRTAAGKKRTRTVRVVRMSLTGVTAT